MLKITTLNLFFNKFALRTFKKNSHILSTFDITKGNKTKKPKKKAKAVRNTKKIANSFGKIRNDETAEIQSEFKENIPLLNVHSTYYTHVSYLF